jgi:hypothetical protein
LNCLREHRGNTEETFQDLVGQLDRKLPLRAHPAVGGAQQNGAGIFVRASAHGGGAPQNGKKNEEQRKIEAIESLLFIFIHFCSLIDLFIFCCCRARPLRSRGR